MTDFKHISTNINIKKYNKCKRCPLKVITKDNTIQYGIGNIITNVVFILPNYNNNAKKRYNTVLKELHKQFKEILNVDLFEVAYVTRVVKCFNYTNYNFDNSSIEYCIGHLCYELLKLQPTHIILVGDANTHCVDYTQTILNNVKYFKIYNPLVMTYDNEVIKDRFVKQINYIKGLL